MILPAHFSQVAEGDDQGLFVGTLGRLKKENSGLQKAAQDRETFQR